MTTVAEEGLASDTQGHRALLPAGDGSRMVEGERGNLPLFCFLRASSESSDWVIFFFEEWLSRSAGFVPKVKVQVELVIYCCITHYPNT